MDKLADPAVADRERPLPDFPEPRVAIRREEDDLDLSGRARAVARTHTVIGVKSPVQFRSCVRAAAVKSVVVRSTTYHCGFVTVR